LAARRARDLLDQPREARLVALEAPDLAPPLGDLLAEARDHRGALGALALRAPSPARPSRTRCGRARQAGAAGRRERGDLLAPAAQLAISSARARWM
jgi:hypothetical protein